MGGFTTPDRIPFWLRSNQYGSVPLDNASLSIIGTARKDYDTGRSRIFDWGASLEGRVNLGQGSNFTLIEGYGKFRISIFEIRAGRTKEIMGLCDSTLSSGSFSVSGNAPGIPKIQISVPEFFIVPKSGQLFAFRGHLAHGWFGRLPMLGEDVDTLQINTFFHQKSLYGRFGKPEWKWKLYGGFNHQAFWGNEQTYFGDIFKLSTVQAYYFVITGTPYGNNDIPRSKVGNHLGSIDVGLEYNFKRFKLLLYRQNVYEAGALYYLANIQDGLNGLSLENKENSNKTFRWRKFLFEILYTKNQAGEPWSPPTPSPFEGYYNHYQYIQGWSYKRIGLGTPFISTRTDTREELPSHPREYFINNRVLAFHIGYEGSVKNLNYTLKASWSNNYGTYRTTDAEQSTNISNPGAYGLFGIKEQLSGFFKCEKDLKNDLSFGCIAAFDMGELFYNSYGLLLSLSKSF